MIPPTSGSPNAPSRSGCSAPSRSIGSGGNSRCAQEITALWDTRRVKASDAENFSSLEKHIGKTCRRSAARSPSSRLRTSSVSILPSRLSPAEIRTAAELEIRYSHYIDAQDRRVDRLKKMDDVAIPEAFDYDAVTSLSMESRIKLKNVRPSTLGQASRISGLRQSDIMLLMIHLR